MKDTETFRSATAREAVQAFAFGCEIAIDAYHCSKNREELGCDVADAFIEAWPYFRQALLDSGWLDHPVSH